MPHTYFETNKHHLKRTLLNDNMTHLAHSMTQKSFLPMNLKIIKNSEIFLYNFVNIT